MILLYFPHACHFSKSIRSFQVESNNCLFISVRVRLMVFNITFNNISVISWRSLLLVEKTTDLSQVTDKFYRILLYRVHHTWAVFELTTWVVTDTDCIDNCKSNYHAITTTTAPFLYGSWISRFEWLGLYWPGYRRHLLLSISNPDVYLHRLLSTLFLVE